MGCLYSVRCGLLKVDFQLTEISPVSKGYWAAVETGRVLKWPSPQHLSKKAPNARKIQAWWRGTLVRRSLLRAALSAWIIQCWWRKTLAKRHEKNRLMILYLMAQETRACVIIQSWVRMLKIRQYYSRLCYATHVIQTSWRWHKCHTRGFFQGSYELVGHKLRLQLDIFLGSWVCRISDCISLPIKN
ncbi:IQ domain-containing protein F5-like isoform X3 [Mastomys coucha]|uniref:IQ domain-containing protein F5-like isoform X3 n=1 Tax=Mastomys coucha TaxID=35658 RepID=UPI0012626E0D|nr:IQ domain-containing protein F5-like isoform X3 [Mastomys coucha]